MNRLFTGSLLATAASVLVPSIAPAQAPSAATLARTREPFSFVVSAPYDAVFPLFGAHEERKWAAGFEPEFLYPVPPKDQPGMVFTTTQDGLPRVWVNTAFDAASGHVQYAYWIADIMVAFIDIHVQRSGSHETKVDVVYERTALRPEANQKVLDMAHSDANSGPRWAEMITGYLRSASAK